MCESFRVSKTVVREALKALETMALIQKQQGRVSTTTSRESWNLLDPLVIAAHVRCDDNYQFLDDLVSVRMAIEAEMARQAAVRATEAEISLIAEHLGVLEGMLGDPEAYKAHDPIFHWAIMEASHNRIGFAVASAIHQQAAAAAPFTMTGTPAELLQRSHAGHRTVYACIVAKDPDGAAAAMRRHIASSWESRRTAPVVDVEPATAAHFAAGPSTVSSSA
jgi:DNA-binding FadR family transcriptional regulator